MNSELDACKGSLAVQDWNGASVRHLVSKKPELHTHPHIAGYQPCQPVRKPFRRTADRQADTYSAHSASQECINTEAIALGRAETELGMHVEAKVRPECSPSAQESFILWQTWEKGTVVIRPMEGGGEKRLITSCLEKMSEAADIKNSEGHLRSNIFSHSIKIEKIEMKKRHLHTHFSFPIY